MKLLNFLRQLILRPGHTAAGELPDKFIKKFGYRFSNVSLLLEALTHRSYVYHSNGSAVSNERLEFLGDSVLGVVIAKYLFDNNPDYDEGDLTKTKALLVNETSLSMVGADIGLNDLILMSPEEEKSGGRDRSSIISDAMEAVIGALFLDGGLKAARNFIYQTVLRYSDEIFSDSTQRNYKGELLEFMQHRGQPPPYYEVISEEGPDHEKTFHVIVKTAGELSGTGSGPSKKEAEQKAAAESLKRLKRQERLKKK